MTTVCWWGLTDFTPQSRWPLDLALCDAGIYVRKDRIELIEFSDESDEPMYAPAFVATKRGRT